MIPVIRADGQAEIRFLEELRARYGEADKQITETAAAIMEDVKLRGDEAVSEYALRLDGAAEVRRYTKSDFEKAYIAADGRYRSALEEAAKRIRAFHRRQRPKGFEMKVGGVRLGQTVRALERVGVYVPGGTAAYPSTVLMCVIPAKIAGVKEIVLISPPRSGSVNPDILAAAYVAEADELLTVGGVQGVAALTYGTKTIRRADKIVGPGNAYVAAAKRLAYGIIDIDMVAGPSDITVMADETAVPSYIAADLLSQAEHDRQASAILVTTSPEIARRAKEEVEKKIQTAVRREIAEESIRKYGGIIIADSAEEMTRIVNAIAPEHLEICVKNPQDVLQNIKNAGSVFLGNYSPEPLGDYLAGTNHVLPTAGTARFFSPLSVESFVKRMQYLEADAAALQKASGKIVYLAEKEGLFAHAEAVKERKL